MNEIIMGVDIGYGNSKGGSGVLIKSGVKRLSVEPPFMDTIVEYNGEYYAVGRSKMDIQKSKTENENTRILTMATIAGGLKKKGIKTGDIRLGIGLPLTRMAAEKNDYRDYMLQKSNLKFRYEGVSYDINLKSVDVYPQGYSGAIYALDSFWPSTVIVDIGSWTIDILPIEDKLPDMDRCKSLRMGVITAMNDINEVLRQKFDEEATEVVIRDIMINGTSDINKEYLAVIQDGLCSYVEDVMNSLRSLKLISSMTHLVFMGGGAVVIKNFLKEKDSNITIIDDIFANAKGYEKLLSHKYKVGCYL